MLGSIHFGEAIRDCDDDLILGHVASQSSPGDTFSLGDPVFFLHFMGEWIIRRSNCPYEIRTFYPFNPIVIWKASTHCGRVSEWLDVSIFSCSKKVEGHPNQRPGMIEWCTPLEFNMKPESNPHPKGDSFWKPSFSGYHLNLWGVYLSFPTEGGGRRAHLRWC